MTLWSRMAELASSVGQSFSSLVAPMGDGASDVPQNSVAFTAAMIALSAKMAKADGEVTCDEVAAFHRVFEFDAAEDANVSRFFDQARRDTAGFELYARQIADMFEPGSEILENVLSGLYSIATADGKLDPDEQDYLATVAGIFAFDQDAFDDLVERLSASPVTDPWAVLGLKPDVDNETLRRTYLRFVRDLHPDRQIGLGLPVEAIQLATNKLARINVAYGMITAERGL